jgi:hypothetical protein
MASITQTVCSKLKTTANREALIYLVDEVLTGKLVNKHVATGRLTSYLAGFGIEEGELSDFELQGLKADLLAVEIVKIVFPYVPSTGVLDRLYDSMCSHNTTLLIEVDVVESIKGGFIVYKAGKVVDMSFKTKIEKLFTQESFRAKILPLLQ